MSSTIPGVYKKGVIKPKKELDLEDDTEVEIRIPKKTLEGMGKQLVSDKELEQFLEETEENLSKV